jgi:hypothetical protein
VNPPGAGSPRWLVTDVDAWGDDAAEAVAASLAYRSGVTADEQPGAVWSVTPA